MTDAMSRTQLAYPACGRRTKYSASRIGRNRNRKVGSVKSTRQTLDLSPSTLAVLSYGPLRTKVQGLRTLWSCENKNVLPRKRFVDLRQRVAFRFDFHLGLGHRHLVVGPDR